MLGKLNSCFGMSNEREVESDEGLVPNLPRGRDRSIGGDLDVGEEGSE
jgi:hypothetical protein